MKKFKKYNIKDIFNMRKNTKVKIGILIFLCLIIGLSIFSISRSLLVDDEEIKSIEIKSDGWDNNEPGSWKVTKNAEWTGIDTVKLELDIDSIKQSNKRFKDIVIVMDTSVDINNELFSKEQNDVKELIDFVLSNEENRIALISFNKSSSVLSELTNNKEELNLLVDELKRGGGNTSYYDYPLIDVNNVLNNYVASENRDLMVLFLAGTPHVGGTRLDCYIDRKYNLLKTKYNVDIYGIEYGSRAHPLEMISDYQYTTNNENPNNILLEVTKVTEPFEEIDIESIIDNEYFDIVSSEIDSLIGTVSIEENKISWNISKNELYSGVGSTLEIELKLKDQYYKKEGLYSIDKNINISATMNDLIEKQSSEKSLLLKAGYDVIYDVNVPEGCTLKTQSTEKHFAFENVVKSMEELSCSGYQFKGWEVSDYDVEKINDDIFVMPSRDINIKATWTKVDISKSMEGTIFDRNFILPFNGESAVMDNVKSTYVTSATGINFSNISGNSNGLGLYVRAGSEYDKYPIMYYRGNVTNNNVLFANYCWKIVRTTEKGGTKLIYAGRPTESDGKKICNNTGTAAQLSETAYFYGVGAYELVGESIGSVGYMYDDSFFNNIAKVNNNAIFGADVKWDGEKYTLENTTSKYDTNHRYTCNSLEIECENVYFKYFDSGYFKISNGQKISDIEFEIFANKTDSYIKKYIDSWYENNILSYTKYLEDAIWCNDRSSEFYLENNYSINLTIGGSFAPTSQSKFYVLKDIESCPNQNDRFTVNDTIIGNGDLIYPVAMLTLNELYAAGQIGAVSTYLRSNTSWWTLTPSGYNGYYSIVYSGANGTIDENPTVNNVYAVRPSIVLKEGIVASSGDGTASNPYVVVTEEDA